MKRLVILAIFGLIFTSLVGCSSVEQKLREKIIKDSAVLNSKEYSEYQRLKEDGVLDDDDNYIYEKLEDADYVEYGDGPIHVVFARNSYIDVSYFSDSDKQNKMNEGQLNPGDKVYYSIVRINNLNSKYSFDGFRIIELIEDNKNVTKKVLSEIKPNDEIVIPDNLSGSEIIIEPIGIFDKRTIKLSDYIVDSNSIKHEQNGEWIVNGKTYYDKTIGLDPSESVIVKYKYNPSDFFIEESEPTFFYNNLNQGIVSFDIVDTNEGDANFSIKLHKTINVDLKGNIKKGIAEIFINNKKIDNKESIENLKWGDVIMISSTEGYNVFSNDLKQIENSSNGNRITFEVPQGNEDSYSIRISKDSSDIFETESITNGTIEYMFEDDKTALKDGIIIEDSRKIVVTIKPNEGFYLSGKDVKDNVYKKTFKFSDYKNKIDAVLDQLEIKKYININLIEEGKYGYSSYKLDGKKVNESKIVAKDGQKLTITYELKDNNYQIKKDDGNVIENIISLINQNKVSLDIVIDESLRDANINGEEYFSVLPKED